MYISISGLWSLSESKRSYRVRARPHPGRQPRSADAGLGSYVCLLTSPQRLPALLLPPDAAVPPGPGLGPGLGPGRGLGRLSERRGTSKVACPAVAGGQRAELGGGGGVGGVGAASRRPRPQAGRGRCAVCPPGAAVQAEGLSGVGLARCWCRARPHPPGSAGSTSWGRSSGLRVENAGGGRRRRAGCRASARKPELLLLRGARRGLVL